MSGELRERNYRPQHERKPRSELGARGWEKTHGPLRTDSADMGVHAASGDRMRATVHRPSFGPAGARDNAAMMDHDHRWISFFRNARRGWVTVRDGFERAIRSCYACLIFREM